MNKFCTILIDRDSTMKIGNFTLTAYTLYMGISLLGRSPLEFYTKKVIEEGNRISQPLPDERKKYFRERSKELGYNRVNFDQWDLMMTDGDFMCFGDEEAAISLIPFDWPLTRDRSKQSIIETFAPVKKTYRNDTSIVDKITFNDIDNDPELRTQLIESYGIVPITKEEEDANIEIRFDRVELQGVPGYFCTVAGCLKGVDTS
ncbi:hypothetical protein PPL_00510 [Heterostelium album PN500]|uniref:Uncharacterized protein n=1 Tax=Heterostelium pallidum (strain ATCC 26659 / Pp 5 / PN500) TaxID=670386 RepID=D3AWN4_HETP5|nr:hypothetical protein PPL_00510 [Heterostelium album PN500]EFA86707.1 hypothetical protein PPL_00510 [Heterostelium album PN500]|eukprot:XP_020438811.1 hypothetical protein PPL_00510 [Heterostelium album PN500]